MDTEDAGEGPTACVGEEQGVPAPIRCGSAVLDVAFHPSSTVGAMCVAVVGGELEVWSTPFVDTLSSLSATTSSGATASTNGNGGKSGEAPHRVAVVKNLYPRSDQASCRTIAFDPTGAALFTGGSNGALHGMDTSRGEVLWTASGAHSSAVNRVSSALGGELGPWALVTGDEDGDVKLWDTRITGRTACIAKAGAVHSDFVSDFCLSTKVQKVLLSTGGDGVLAALDVRKFKVLDACDEQETELLSVITMKNGSKVVVGTQEGTLDIFNAGDWADVNDRFPGHPQAIECLLKVNEDILLTGSDDGMIRVLEIHPNRLLGVIGFHDDFPVERMAFSSNNRVVASCSHDELVRFWNTGFLFEEGGDDDSDNEDGEHANKGGVSAAARAKRRLAKNEKRRKPKATGASASAMEEEDDDDDDSDDDDNSDMEQEDGDDDDDDGDMDEDEDDEEEDAAQAKKKSKKNNAKGAGKFMRPHGFPERKRKPGFFDDI